MKVLFTALTCLALATSGVHSLHGGTAATIGQHPSQVVINLPGGRFCSGTIIHTNHVLTASRCILDDNNELMVASQVTVRAGAIGAADPNAQFVSAAVALFPHQLYSPFSGEHDIAVIRTQNNFTFNANIANPTIAIADRYQRVIPDATTCTVAGWNAPTPAIPNPLLQHAAVTVVARTDCGVPQRPVLESTLCARSPVAAAARPAICESNRGAGLFCRDHLVGVASAGFACATAASPEAGVYTQVRMYESWILNQLNRTRIPLAGPTPIPGQPESSATMSAVSMALVGGIAMLMMVQ